MPLALLALALSATPAAVDLAPVAAQVTARHEENLARLRDWIALPTIAAEGLNVPQGAEKMAALLRDAGFQRVERLETGGSPAVFARLDAGAKRTVGLYFMYDVKQFDPKEWSSPPLEGRIVDRPGLGKVLVGRGALNQKGPQSAFLAALHALRAAGRKSPVNLVLVAEGEEEIGSPHLGQVMRRPEVQAAFAGCAGVFMPSAGQTPEGVITVSLGAKGVVELELVASGEAWGRGPSKDVHSANRARLDSPAFHLVQALATLVDAGGDPAIDGFADRARPLSPEQARLVDEAAARMSEEGAKKLTGAKVWAHDASFRDALAAFVSRPTVNIEGLVAGWTGPGGMTVLPHRAVAKLDLRLVPDMTFDGAVAALKAHLARRGFGDIEVRVTGGYDPTETPAAAALIQKELAVYRRLGLDPTLWPRNAGSYPGYAFTNPPLSLAASHFGVGHGGDLHAPNEYLVVESANPKVKGYDDAVMAFVEYLHELAR
ncbi:MAG: M20/M25/M40 family metallo-hydrolase [Anaeromyxobacter sp.]